MIPNGLHSQVLHVPREGPRRKENDSKLSEKVKGSGLWGLAVLLGSSAALVYLSHLAGLFSRDVVTGNQAKQAQVYQQRADAEERARPENVAERNQLRNLVDTDGNGSISPKEYARFREATGRTVYFNTADADDFFDNLVADDFFDRGLADDLSRMSPNEVGSTIRMYGEAR